MRRFLTVCATGVLAACGDSNGPQLQPAAFQLVEGAAQVDTVGRELKDLIAVRVIATDGATAVPNIPITWTALDGGQVFAAVVLSGSDGIARQRYTLGTAAGTQRIRLTALDGETGGVLVDDTITADAVPGRATTFAIVPTDLFFWFDSLSSDTVGIEIQSADEFGNTTPPCAGLAWTSADAARIHPLDSTALRGDKYYALFDLDFDIGGPAIMLTANPSCGAADSVSVNYTR